jgi:hypothetical protein
MVDDLPEFLGAEVELGEYEVVQDQKNKAGCESIRNQVPLEKAHPGSQIGSGKQSSGNNCQIEHEAPGKIHALTSHFSLGSPPRLPYLEKKINEVKSRGGQYGAISRTESFSADPASLLTEGVVGYTHG